MSNGAFEPKLVGFLCNWCSYTGADLAGTERMTYAPNIRNIPTKTPTEGVGIIEAPRGTLIHHYKTDKRGIVEEVNLIVATIHNSAAITMSVEKAAKAFIKGGKVSEGLLNMVEMAFRPYDPCHACGTHALPGDMPLVINIYDKNRGLIKQLKRD